MRQAIGFSFYSKLYFSDSVQLFYWTGSYFIGFAERVIDAVRMGWEETEISKFRRKETAVEFNREGVGTFSSMLPITAVSP